jgi:hypothetical protein
MAAAGNEIVKANRQPVFHDPALNGGRKETKTRQRLRALGLRVNEHNSGENILHRSSNEIFLMSR